MSAALTFDELIERASPYAEDFEQRPGETLRLDPLDPSEAPAASLHPHDSTLTMLGTLGTGGMSIVRLARQESVGREVAVKTLRPEQATPRAARRLLAEAWVTGYLEHPRVVPLHDVRTDASGAPVVVLKRIEGRRWQELLADPGLISELGDPTDDVLGWHLDVLIAVCHALEFAHDRGVVHRDVKPDNVMVGRFGEVTLLDWGIAVCVRADVDARLPRWSPGEGVVGTPAYMAPELLQRGVPPDPQVDVYGVGACLFELLMGRPPHSSSSLAKAIASMLQAPVVKRGPTPLRTLCVHALQVQPADRPTSVRAVRKAMQRYLVDRGVDRVAESALARLELLEGLVGEGSAERSAGAATPADQAQDRSTAGAVVAQVAACRFGFQQVLEVRPEHELARAGLDAALQLGAGWALEAGRPVQAQLWLAEVAHPAPGLVRRVAGAVETLRTVEGEVRDLRRRYDPVAARRAGAWVVAALWMVSGVVPLLVLDTAGTGSPPLSAVLVVSGIGIVAAVVLMRRPQLVPHRVARSYAALLALLPAIAMFTGLGLTLQGVGTADSTGLVLVLVGLVGLVGALMLDRRLAVAAAASALLWLGSSVGWVATATAVGASNGILGLCCAWVFLSARQLEAR